jgi:hypothetical protein
MADVTTNNEGAVIMFTPESDLGKQWVEDNLDLEPWQWRGNSFSVEPTYVPDILKGMKEDGLKVESTAKVAAAPFVPTGKPQIPQRLRESVAVGAPAEDEEKRTVPPELPNALFHMARGGWKRISMNTVQSDDDRFTITQIDPTRRSKWFLLKDLITGESYENPTMTEAKMRAKKISDYEGLDQQDKDNYDYPVVEEPTDLPQSVLAFTNKLLNKK